ncbi:hypothetical protein CEY12_14725 [Chryseobacterium sp. T16E-39]|uniref:hypothetical protein n=1 Tax=Chryseobacterium sp. T16E-39 TaxID=2015076 RepID=UPI000B5B2071|nr:hypothetical protein [Chryseobacterium sp. T16E-39]ASK31282.1 hypothetical protein CEY12_14725 [Chryseobacterium sp. T16E-39]
MRKNLIIRLMLLTASVVWLNSCSSEEDFLNNKQEKLSNKFQVFSAKKKETINYGNGFKTLLERYDEINKVQHTLKAIRNVWKNSSKIADEYVEFNIRSQDITTKNNEKYTLFPLIKNYTVEGIIIAVLKENGTQVEFLKMSPEADNYNVILGLFRAQYIKSNSKNKSSNKAAGGPCGFDGYPSCDIEPVVITIGGGGGGGGSLPPGGGWIPPGGCGPYEDCLNNPDAGGTAGSDDNPNNSPNANPCEKTKSILSDPKVQAKIKELKTQAPKGGEIGVKIKSDGTTSTTILGGTHEVDLGDTSGYQGGYHNHTPNGIKMLSPPDIIKLFDFSIAQPNGNIGNGFMGMIGSESCSSCPGGIRYYNYIINFSGTSQELSQFLYNTSWDLNKLKTEFQILEGQMALDLSNVDYLGADLNAQGLEKLFFETLRGMGMEGKVNLQRIEDNGAVKNITLNSGGATTTATPCP